MAKAGSKKTKAPPRTGKPAGPGIQVLMEQRDRLYQEALENPGSESSEMLRAFLLSGIVATRTESSEAKPGPAELKIRELDSRLEQVARAAEEAKAAAEGGKEWDALAVYNRIAEIVGLRQPLKPIGPPQPIKESEDA